MLAFVFGGSLEMPVALKLRGSEAVRLGLKDSAFQKDTALACSTYANEIVGAAVRKAGKSNS